MSRSLKLAGKTTQTAGLLMGIMRLGRPVGPAAKWIGWAVAALWLAGCAYEVGFQPDYLPNDRPPYVAKGRLLIVMPEDQRQFVYEGAPSSTTGDFTTLTVPIGQIVQDIAQDVFGGCFAYGVDFVNSREGQDDYVLALEGDMQQFIYSYTKVIDQGFDGQQPDAWITPEVSISFAVRAYDRAGAVVLDKVYDSGVKAGESYLVSGRPAERINRTLHETLHALMLQVVADIRPLLVDECEIVDAADDDAAPSP